MKSTTPTFNPFTSERTVNCHIRFELLDENAKDNAIPTVTEQEPISQPSQLTDGQKKMSDKYTSLEHNVWLLDGESEIMPDDVSEIQTGWWGQTLSGENSVFPHTVGLSFTFNGVPVDTVGYMLYFDDTTDSYPTEIRVTTYAADYQTIIAQETFSNDQFNCVIEMPVLGYYGVTFEFLKTRMPGRRVRVVECLFGIVQEFDWDNLVSAEWIYAADLISESFPSRQLTFTFENIGHKYNLINPEGLYAYLQLGQNIYSQLEVNGESVDMGVFEFTTATADDDGITGKITGNDKVLLSLAGTFNGGSGATATLQDAISAVLSGLDITTSLEYPAYTVSLAIPQGTTQREAIRLLAQASRCAVWFDRDGVLQMHPLAVSLAENDELNADRMPSLGGISVAEPVDSVELTVTNEYAEMENVYVSGAGMRIKTVSNPCVAAANGQAVADWILAQCNRRVRYSKINRCNPAIEVADTLKIYDAYGENRNAAVKGIEITYDGGLAAVTQAVGQ